MLALILYKSVCLISCNELKTGKNICCAVLLNCLSLENLGLGMNSAAGRGEGQMLGGTQAQGLRAVLHPASRSNPASQACGALPGPLQP